jgi:hypothetical protein
MRTSVFLFLTECAVLSAPLEGQTHARAVSAAAPESAPVARSKTLEDLASKLSDRFVDPDVAQRYAAMLRASEASGKYDSIADDSAFAKQVTADLQAIAFDGHLKLFPQPKDQPTGIPAGSPAASSKTVEATARLTKDIAYIRLGNFFGTDEGLAAVRKFMADNSDAKTIIFDVRTHVGGGLDEMDVIFPLIFDKPTTLVDLDTRSVVDAQTGNPFGAVASIRRVAAPDTVVRREHFVTPAVGAPLAHAKVFVLTSGRTGSAGEHFVLALKRTHRATVIGETTYGAGNYGGFVPIVGGFSAFIPVGRTFDPDTGKGWDYVGIAPEVAVPAAEAMIEALVRSGVAREEAARLSEQYGPSADRVTSKRKAPASIAGI